MPSWILVFDRNECVDRGMRQRAAGGGGGGGGNALLGGGAGAAGGAAIGGDRTSQSGWFFEPTISGSTTTCRLHAVIMSKKPRKNPMRIE